MNLERNPRSNDPGLDILKAAATLLVIVGHVIQFTNPNFDDSPLFKIIYAFHMPLFMCISGYLAPKIIAPGFLLQKFNQLVVPFIIWSIILIAIRNFVDSTDIIAVNYIGDFLRILMSPENSLWFLWVLYLNCIAFSILHGRHILKLSLILIICLYILQFISSDFSNFGLNLFRWHYAFFIFGFCIREKYIAIEHKNYFWLIAIVTILALAHWDRNLATIFFGLEIKSVFASKIWTLVTKYVAAIGMLWILFGFKEKIKYRSSSTSFLSKHSLGYYGAQTVLLIPATLIWDSQTIVNQVSVFFFTLTMCTVLIVAFDKIDITRRLLLGRRQ